MKTYTETLVQDVTAGMQVLVEIGPGDEVWPVVKDVIVNDNGTFGFEMAMLGLVDGWRTDEVVCVQS